MKRQEFDEHLKTALNGNLSLSTKGSFGCNVADHKIITENDYINYFNMAKGDLDRLLEEINGDVINNIDLIVRKGIENQKLIMAHARGVQIEDIDENEEIVLFTSIAGLISIAISSFEEEKKAILKKYVKA